MRRTGTAALLAGGVLAFGVTACGGSDDDGDSTGASSAPATTTEAAKTSGSGLTPPGTQLAPGDKAKLGWVPSSALSTGTTERKAIPVEVTVEEIEKGTKDDLKDINVSGHGESTPYFVKAHITNLGTAPEASDDPDLKLQAFDDRGQRQPNVTFIGKFPRCSNDRPPEPFSRGKSYDTCLTFLLGGGGSITEVRWNDGSAAANKISPYYDKPVVWKG